MCDHISRTRLNADEFDGYPKYEKCNICGEILAVKWGRIKDGMTECCDCGKIVKSINAHTTCNIPLQNFCKPPRYWGTQYQCKRCNITWQARSSFPYSDDKITV